jgi:transposase
VIKTRRGRNAPDFARGRNMGRKEKGIINPYMFYNLRKQYTCKEIAKQLGYTESGLWRWCKRNGVITKRLMTSEVLEELETKNVKEIAYEYNLAVSTIYKKLSRKGYSVKKNRGIK